MSRLPVRVTLRAAREIAEAGEWWAENRPAAPELLAREIRRAFELLSHHPKVGARAESTRLPGIRRVHLSGVNYHLYYRVVERGAVVEVLALWHTSRGRRADV